MLPRNRKEAIAQKSKYFFTGKECRNGHLCRRYTLSRACEQCKASNSAKHYSDNKQAYKDRAILWAKNNLEERNATVRRHRAKYPERWKAVYRRAAAKRYADNPKEVLERNRTRKVAKIQKMNAAQRGRCYWCKEKYGKTFEVDHVWPRSRGGGNGAENLVLACRKCNRSKHAKTPAEFAGLLL